MDHNRYDYSPIIKRPPIKWPNGARVAVWVIPNIEYYEFSGMRALPDYRRRGEEAELGIPGARHNQFSPAQRVVGGRGEEGDPGDDSNHYQDGGKGSRRMVRPGPGRNVYHSRFVGRGRHSLSLRLV